MAYMGNEYYRERYAADPQKHMKNVKAWKKKNPEKTLSSVRAHNWKQRFGITPGEYYELKKNQGGKCAICRIATGQTKALAVDHDHKTGQVRGLLCGPCNRLVGMIERFSMERIKEYLMHPPASFSNLD